VIKPSSSIWLGEQPAIESIQRAISSSHSVSFEVRVSRPLPPGFVDWDASFVREPVVPPAQKSTKQSAEVLGLCFARSQSCSEKAFEYQQRCLKKGKGPKIDDPTWKRYVAFHYLVQKEMEFT
jgi:hypothetical protein